MNLTRSTHINHALLGLARRAETADRHSLARSFVAAGSLSSMLLSADHQILYGRRGTGKTHALLYLSDLLERSGDVPVYLDLRTIGSAGGGYSDTSINAAQRGTYLVVDTLEAIHEELLDHAIKGGPVADQDGLLRGLDALAEAATSVEVVGEVERETTIGGANVADGTEELSGSLSNRGLTGIAKSTSSRQRWLSAENRMRRTGVEQSRVVFGQLNRALRGVVDALGQSRLWLLLDEWSSVPFELQPLLADLLRRSVLPTRGTTVKIAAVERRSRFRELAGSGEYVGIEVGADAASAVSLDDFMIFHHNNHRAQQFFQQLFYNHTEPRLAPNLADTINDPAAFVQAAFRKNAFAELVRAAEGVPRDAINIAAMAAQRANTQQINLTHIRTAARDWYLRDKQHAITADEVAHLVLRDLVDEVVGRRKMRTFLLDEFKDAQHPAILELCDARLLHVLQRGITDRKRPGTLYDGFAIDYGCYVSLLLDGTFEFDSSGKELRLNSKRVPQEDFSLHRAVVDLAALGRQRS